MTIERPTIVTAAAVARSANLSKEAFANRVLRLGIEADFILENGAGVGPSAVYLKSRVPEIVRVLNTQKEGTNERTQLARSE